MIKKTITFASFDGQQLTEDFYFNVTQAEALEKQFDVDQNGKEIQFTDVLTRIAAEKRPSELVRIFRLLIEWSYGIKSEDGRRFTKSPAILEEFKSTNAFSDLYLELAQDAEKASAFTQGILPANMQNTATAAAPSGFRPGTDLNARPVPPNAIQQVPQQVQQHIAERPFEVNDAQPQPGQYVAPPAPQQ